MYGQRASAGSDGGRTDLKWGKVVKECLRTKLFEGGRYESSKRKDFRRNRK